MHFVRCYKNQPPLIVGPNTLSPCPIKLQSQCISLASKDRAWSHRQRPVSRYSRCSEAILHSGLRQNDDN